MARKKKQSAAGNVEQVGQHAAPPLPPGVKLLRTLEGHKNTAFSVAFDPQGHALAGGSGDGTVKLWDAGSGKLLRTLEGHKDWVNSAAFNSQGHTLASGSDDDTMKLWDVGNGKLLRTLEGHIGQVDIVAFSPDGCLLASKSLDQTIRLWNCDTWETVAVIPEPTNPRFWIRAIAFHPTLPLLAAAGSAPGTPEDERSRLIHLWELDYDVLLGQSSGAAPAAVHHTTGKIVVVGDHSVGKSALGWRMIHGEFKEQASTHGQHFWPFPALGKRRADGTECEAILWDFAGQPDYRLVHALFVDDADLALVLFDASDIHDPLHGVDFWLKQLNADSQCRTSVPVVPASGAIETIALHSAERKATKIILVVAQTDRGSCTLTDDELTAFCQRHGIAGPTTTSAFTGAEMLTAVGHLENYGYVKRLRTSQGAERILLEPQRLNNLASSFVLEARRNPKGSEPWRRNDCWPATTAFRNSGTCKRASATCCWTRRPCCSWNTMCVSARPIRYGWSGIWCSRN